MNDKAEQKRSDYQEEKIPMTADDIRVANAVIDLLSEFF